MKQGSKRLTIGRSDRADFPALGLENVQVKTDTGAFSSSLHASEIELSKREDEEVLTFIAFDPEHPSYTGEKLQYKEFTERKVKSSNGKVQTRFAITVEVLLFDRLFPLRLTLTDRTDMRYPVLLGRDLLRQGFLVDVRRKNLSLRSQNKKKDTL